MSRLYPGFGSGKGTFTADYTVQTLSSSGRADMEAGDKIILPQSALRDITRLKLPFPLIFRVMSDKCVHPLRPPNLPPPLFPSRSPFSAASRARRWPRRSQPRPTPPRARLPSPPSGLQRRPPPRRPPPPM